MLELIWVSAALPVGITVAALVLAWIEARWLAPTPLPTAGSLRDVAADLRLPAGSVADPGSARWELPTPLHRRCGTAAE